MGRKKLTNAHGFLDYRLAPGGTCEIVEIEVEHEYRGEGIGRSMLQELAAIPGVLSIYAFTGADNFIAHDFYRHCGFDLYFVPRFYGVHRDAYLCVKVLNG